jgi:hypothetical protein
MFVRVKFGGCESYHFCLSGVFSVLKETGGYFRTPERTELAHVHIVMDSLDVEIHTMKS